MAAARTAIVDQCGVCYEVMKVPRALNCQHSICLECLHEEECKREVACPVCCPETAIEDSYRRKLLSGCVSKDEEKIKLFDFLACVKQRSTFPTDEDNQGIYREKSHGDKPVEMFSYNGRPLGSAGKIGFFVPRLAMDTRRGLLLALVYKNSIYTYDKNGRQTGTIKCREFQMLDDITYDVRQDNYIVVDKKAGCIMFVNPKNHTISKIIPPEEEDEMLSDDNVVSVASDKSGKSSMFVTTDSRSSAVRLYDGEGRHIRGYKDEGTGLGQFYHPVGVCFDPEGQIIVSDCDNCRLVCMSSDAADKHQQWSLSVHTKKLI